MRQLCPVFSLVSRYPRVSTQLLSWEPHLRRWPHPERRCRESTGRLRTTSMWHDMTWLYTSTYIHINVYIYIIYNHIYIHTSMYIIYICMYVHLFLLVTSVYRTLNLPCALLRQLRLGFHRHRRHSCRRTHPRHRKQYHVVNHNGWCLVGGNAMENHHFSWNPL